MTTCEFTDRLIAHTWPLMLIGVLGLVLVIRDLRNIINRKGKVYRHGRH